MRVPSNFDFQTRVATGLYEVSEPGRPISLGDNRYCMATVADDEFAYELGLDLDDVKDDRWFSWPIRKSKEDNIIFPLDKNDLLFVEFAQCNYSIRSYLIFCNSYGPI